MEITCITPNEEIRNIAKEVLNAESSVVSWARTSENSYEVSSKGDRRFSALNATFKPGTIIDGVDVGGRTIEDVYQSVIKKSGKGQAPSKDSKLYKPYNYKNNIPFIRQLSLLGRFPVPSSDIEEIKKADKARKDINRITKTSKSYNIFRNLLNFGRFADVNIDSLDISEDTKKRIRETQKKFKNSPSYNPLNTVNINEEDAKSLALEYKDLYSIYTSLLDDIAKEIWNIRLKTTPITFSALDLTPLGEKELLQSKEDIEDFTYTIGYLPLWQEWARQNPELIEELREKSKGKVLTDQFANTRVSQARALADILNSTEQVSNKSSNRKGGEKNANSIIPKILDYIREFCAQKGILQETWEDFKDEVIPYVKARLAGETPQVSPVSDIEQAKKRLRGIVDYFHRTVRKRNDFDRSHVYEVLVNGEWKKADISVTQFSRMPDMRKFNLSAYRNASSENIEENVGMALGRTNDVVMRDYFMGSVKDSYPNLDSTRLAALLQDLDRIKDYFNQIFGEGQWYAETEPFSIAAQMHDYYGKPFILAGETDMIVTDSKGSMYIFDMKAIRNINSEVLKDRYLNQLNLYRQILLTAVPMLESYFPNGNSNLGLIVTQTRYPNGKQSDYSIGGEGEVYYKNTPIERLDAEDYSMSLHLFMNNMGEKSPLLSIPVDSTVRSLDMKELESDDDFIIRSIQKAFLNNSGELMDAADEMIASLETDTRTLVDTDQYVEPLMPDQKHRLGVKISKMIAKHVQWLQTDPDAGKILFPEYEENFFIGKSVEEILNETTFPILMDYLKNTYFVNTLTLDDPKFVQKAWIMEHFNDLVFAAPSAFMDNVGLGVDLKVIERKEGMNESENPESQENEEEEGIAEWALDNLELSIEDSNVFSIFKNMLSTLYKIRYTQEYDSESKSYRWVQDDYILDEWGIVDFLDRKEVIQGILDICHDARSSEEMLERLIREESVEKYSWMPQISEFLAINPDLRSTFFNIFRKNAAEYISLNVQSKSDGEHRYYEINSVNMAESGALRNIESTHTGNILDGKAYMFVPVKGSNLGLSTIDRQVYDALDEEMKDEGVTKRWIVKFLEALGFENYIQAVSSLGKKDAKITRLGNTLKGIFKDLGKINYRFIPYSEFLTSNGKNRWLSLYSSLLNIVPMDYGTSVYGGGKNYQVWIAPSFLTDLVSSLRNPDTVDEFIERKYGSTRQAYIMLDNRKVYINSWLNDLHDNSKNASLIRHFFEVSSNNVTYAEMDERQYAESSIYEYWSVDNTYGMEHKLARYHVPTMSDKNSSEFIQYTKHSFMNGNMDNAKREITEKATNIILYEIRRIKETFWSSIDGSPRIEVYSSAVPKEITSILEYNRKLAEEKRNGRKPRIKYRILQDKDIIEDNLLKSFMRQGGAGFRFFTFMNRMLLENSDFRSQMLQYISMPDDSGFSGNLIDNVQEMFIAGMERGFRESFMPLMHELGVPSSLRGLPVKDRTPEEEEERNTSPDMLDTVEDALEEYYWNTRLASANILQMTILDPAFYENTIQVQKRFAQIHAMTEKPDVSAMFEDEDGQYRKLSDSRHRFIILQDRRTASDKLKEINQAFDSFIQTVEDPKEREWYLDLKKRTVHLYESIKDTDGQAFTSLEGYFKKMGMLQVLTPSFRESFFRIRKGDYTNRELQQVFQPIKPFVFSWENLSSDADNAFYAPLQIKDSEYALMITMNLFEGFRKMGIMEDDMMYRLSRMMSESAYTDGVWNGKGIDTVVFASAVKGGGSSILSLDELNEILKSDNPADILNERGYVHQHDFYDWGKQQNVPAHLQNHEQAMPSQTRVLVAAGMADDDMSVYKGYPMSVKDLREEYFRKLEEEFSDGIRKSESRFAVGKSRKKRVKAMSEFLKSRLLRDERTTAEDIRAVSIRNGDFNIPLGDPLNAEKYAGNIFASIKNDINKERIPGGPVVQVSPFGFKNPELVFDSNGNFQYMEAYITFPSEELERSMIPERGDRVWSKLTSEERTLASKGIPISVDRGLELGLITEDDLMMIASRIPVEKKYSIWPMRIKAFLPRILGEMIVIPSEGVVMSGGDFDIDKMYPELKYTEAGGYDMSNEVYQRKNDIIELQWAMMHSKGALLEMFAAQDISVLKEIASELQKDNAAEDYDMTMPEAQFYFQNLNMMGKKMVAVSASSNTAHALGSLCDIDIAVPEVTFNGYTLSNERLDSRMSRIDGSFIGRTFGMFVGASADTAKDPVNVKVGYTSATAGFYTGLLRLGVPVRTVSYMMSQPVVRKLVNLSALTRKSFQKVLKSTVQEKMLELGMQDSDLLEAVRKMEFTDEQLLENYIHPSEDYDRNILFALYAMSDVMDSITGISSFYRLNSTKNSVGPNPWSTLRTMYSLDDFMERLSGKENVVTRLSEDSYDRIIRSLPFIKPLADAYQELVPKIMGKDFPMFGRSFTGLLDWMAVNGVSVGKLGDRSMRNLFKEFMVYLSTGKVNGETLVDGSFEARKKDIFAVPLSIMSKRLTYRDNRFINRLKFSMRNRNGVTFPVISLNTAGMMSNEKDMLTSSWNALLATVDPEELRKNTALSDELFEYNIFRTGFYFSPIGFMNLVPNKVKNTYRNGVYRKISNASNWNETLYDDDYMNFFIQYMRNHPDSFTYIMPKKTVLSITSTPNGDAYIADASSMNTYKGYLALSHRNMLYIRRSLNDNIFYQVPLLGMGKQGFEYNRQEDGLRMKTVFSKAIGDAVMSKFKEIQNMLVQDNMEQDSAEEDYDYDVEESADSSEQDRLNVMMSEGGIRWNSVEDFLNDDIALDIIADSGATATEEDILYSSSNMSEIRDVLLNIVERTAREKDISMERNSILNEIKEFANKLC